MPPGCACLELAEVVRNSNLQREIMPRLQDKVTIITGGSSGIGEATSYRFGEEGSRVAVFDVEVKSGQKTADEINARGGKAIFVNVDVSKESDVAEGVAEVVKTWGKVDVLVNNAGIPGVNKFTHEVTLEEWELLFSINVRGVFLCTKHVLPHMMKAKAGSIVNFSSIYGLVGNDDLPPYHATKGAVLLMTKTDAMCYAKYGIRVNAVHPGPTKTAMFMKAASMHPEGVDAYFAMFREDAPLMLGEPVDVANCVLFLASDESCFVTGSSLVCDGGYTAH
jgi:NAD(P)-dependent dehydrogenase (short-subunit alcohol dehydrogenase family)